MNFINDTDKFDQHFLIDEDVISKYIEICNFNKSDSVVEVGPGKGFISNLIAKKIDKLLLIEYDKRLKNYIDNVVEKNYNVSVIWDNALNVYIPKCNKIISSLPYSITEPFIEKLIRCDFDECILIVGDKFATSTSLCETNKLSLLTNSFFKFEKIFTIERECFDPMPRVRSAIVKLTKIDRKMLDKKMFIIREVFFRRDQKLKNALVNAYIEYEKNLGNTLTKRESKNMVLLLNIDKEMLDKKIENLSNDEFSKLYKII